MERSSNHAAAYYRHLPDRPTTAFRLMVLQPGKPENGIECRLVEGNYDDGHDYEALSYVWGDPNDTLPIRLNDGPFAVTKNLDSALRRLRHPDTYRTLWVDAICINQEDKIERAQQVERMLEIYGHAKQTLVWLGDAINAGIGEEEEANAFTWRVVTFLATALRQSQDADLRYDLLHANDALHLLQGAAKIVGRDWFTRVWVLQEVAVAKKVTLYCGDVSFPWEVLDGGLSAIGDTKDMEKAAHTVRSLSRWHEKRLKSVRFCRDLIQNKEPRDPQNGPTFADRLLGLLLASQGLQASDARDHIFALLGLARGREGSDQGSNLTPDYHSTADEILTKVAIYLLKSTQNVSMVLSAGLTDSQRELGVPTWVPTWQSPGAEHLAEHIHQSELLHRLPENTTPIICEDEKSIVVKGHMLCRITEVGQPADGPVMQSVDSPWIQAKVLFDNWEREIFRPLEGGYPRAWVCAGTRAAGGPNLKDETLINWFISATEIDPTRFWEETLFHQRADKESYNGPVDHLLYATLMDREQLAPGGFNEVARSMFCGLELNRLQFGAPFATSNGLFGFFSGAERLHQCLEEGLNASVCLFQGLNVPFIVANGPKGFVLVGPCFLEPYIGLLWKGGYPNSIKLV